MRERLRASRLGASLEGFVGLALATLAGMGCSVQIDTAREGFPCNPGGSCSEGLVCQDGICVREAVDAGCGAPCRLPTGSIALRAEPATLRADGVSASSLHSDVVVDGRGVPVEDGTRFFLSTTLGSLEAVDAAPDTGDAEIEVTSEAGRIRAVLRAGITPGEATITARSLEGDAAGSVTVVLEPPDETGTIELLATPAFLPADGNTTVTIESQRLEGPDGSPVAGGTLFTVTVSEGTIVTADADPDLPGHQIAVSDGTLAFEARAGLSAGPVDVTVEASEPMFSGSTRYALGPAFASVEAAPVIADGASTTTATARPSRRGRRRGGRSHPRRRAVLGQRHGTGGHRWWCLHLRRFERGLRHGLRAGGPGSL